MSNDADTPAPGHANASDRGLKLRMASEARRVHSQHEQLSLLIADLEQTFASDVDERRRSAFDHFADAFEAHMHVEETLYFPALHGLLPAVDPDLTALTTQHHEMRSALEAIRAELLAGDPAEATHRLQTLAALRTAHETTEEALIERVRSEARLAPDA